MACRDLPGDGYAPDVAPEGPAPKHTGPKAKAAPVAKKGAAVAAVKLSKEAQITSINNRFLIHYFNLGTILELLLLLS